MGWETRKGTKNTYYTRSRRVDGRVLREYMGNTPQAREAARRSDLVRELRQMDRMYWAKTESWLAAAERACDEYCRFVELVLQACMQENGYHYQRGEWRKRRVPKEARGKQSHPAGNNESQGQRDANGSRPKCKSGQCGGNQRPKQPPRRRPVPRRRTLDCRMGLVRGVGRNINVGWNQQRAVPAITCKPPQPFVDAGTCGLPRWRSAGSGLRRLRRHKRARAPPPVL